MICVYLFLEVKGALMVYYWNTIFSRKMSLMANRIIFLCVPIKMFIYIPFLLQITYNGNTIHYHGICVDPTFLPTYVQFYDSAFMLPRLECSTQRNAKKSCFSTKMMVMFIKVEAKKLLMEYIKLALHRLGICHMPFFYISFLLHRTSLRLHIF